MTEEATEEVTERKAGRPAGSRSKTSLMKAQKMIDEFAMEAVTNIIALARNDRDHFDTPLKSDVPATIMLAANKALMDKSVANEKEKLDDLKKTTAKTSIEDTPKGDTGNVTKIGPKVYASAK